MHTHTFLLNIPKLMFFKEVYVHTYNSREEFEVCWGICMSGVVAVLFGMGVDMCADNVVVVVTRP